MILSVTLNPSVDRTVFVDGLKVGDTNRVLRTETDAGGKGVNLSRVAVELGSMSVATGFLGGGPGAFVQAVLDNQSVIHDFVPIQGETRINTNIEDGTGKPPTTLNERGPQISTENWESLLAHVERYANQAEWVALGGSIPPGLAPDSFAVLTALAHRCGAKVVLDADGEPMRLGMLEMPDMIKPNAHEAERLTGIAVNSPETAAEAAQALRERLADGAWVIISMGSAGALLSTVEGIWFAEAPRIHPRSTIGSGDSLIGGMLAGILHEMEPLQAFRQGVAAGSATAMSDGCSIAQKSDVDLLIERVSIYEIG